MTTCICSDLSFLIPEIFLGLLAIILQLIGVMGCKQETFGRLSILGIVIAIYLTFGMSGISDSAFMGRYVVNYYTTICKLLVLISTLLVVIFYIGRSKATHRFHSEYIVLVMLSSMGACIAISARDLIVLFVGLELQALPGYILATFNRNPKSSEAGLKYFVLGAVSSCIMLFGMSMLYGFASSVSYDVISKVLADSANIGLIIGAVFLLSGMMFKLSIVPFHVWTPDVYEGSPIVSVSFFSTAMKLGSLSVLINILFIILPSATSSMTLMLKVLAILSMIVGSVAAVMQTSIKRLMAYSTILNMGYAIVPMMVLDNKSFSISITYLFIYAISTIGLFVAVSISLGDGSDDGTISDLAGLARTKKAAAVIISIFMFSMIGLPPFSGFFGKYYVLMHALRSQEYLLATCILLTSIIAAYYYLNVVKSMYFCDSTIKTSREQLSIESLVLIILTTGFTAFFSLFAGISPLVINFA
jgi:NADH-quinone oxidoreductase subunit N